MKRSTSGWTTAIAAAALLGFPGAGLAQTPATPHTPSQPPATQSPAAPSEQAQSAANTPAEHIAAAKQALASIDSSTVPASVKPQLAQLRTHLNNLEKEVARGNTGATASAKGSGAKWGTEAADVDKIVTNLVGAEGAASAAPASEPSATGTSGRNTATLDDSAKDKLREVRRHVTEMAASMSGAPGAGSAASAAAATSAPATANPDAASAAPAPATSATSSQPGMAPSATPQSTPSPTPQSEQPPATAAPQTTEPSAAQPSAAPAGQVDREAAKQHLSQARESLSQLASMPEASKLQGETRTQVSQLISSFNALITTQDDWKAAYEKVENNLNVLLAPATGAAAAAPAPTADQPTSTTGTPSNPPAAAAGTSGSNAGLDPAIRTKLEEFRTHLKEFEKAAGGVAGSTTPSAPAAPSASTPPAASTASSAPATAPSQPDPAAAQRRRRIQPR